MRKIINPCCRMLIKINTFPKLKISNVERKISNDCLLCIQAPEGIDAAPVKSFYQWVSWGLWGWYLCQGPNSCWTGDGSTHMYSRVASWQNDGLMPVTQKSSPDKSFKSFWFSQHPFWPHVAISAKRTVKYRSPFIFLPWLNLIANW